MLRAAQFAARLGFEVAEETRALCAGMSLDALARERVWGELEKALLKADRPSVFFEVLRKMGQLKTWFPEVEALAGVPQNPVYHPEGDVFRHTMQVLDRAAALRQQTVRPTGLMVSALCHDFGKPAATTFTDGRIRSIGHERAGLPVTETFLDRLSGETRLKKVVLNCVELHMLPNQLASQHSGQKALFRLLDRAVCPEDLLLLARADRGPGSDPAESEKTERYLWDGLAAYRELMTRPAVTGADLIGAGLQPGKSFREALAYAHRLHLSGVPHDAALSQTLAYMKNLQGQEGK